MNHGWELFEQCESVIEKRLLHSLMKFYQENEVKPQYRVGRYRVDFVTCDGIGWELDGKEFHDADRDRKRDEWILANSCLKRIIRVPASCMMFFRDATIAALSCWVDRFQRRSYCDLDSFEKVTALADAVVDDFWIYGKNT